MSTEHLKRKSKIGTFALPFGSKKRELVEKEHKKNLKNPKYRKLVKNSFNKAKYRIDAQVENGIGFPIDSQLRYFLTEYNNRVMTAGLTSMPSNFNIMESFFNFIPELQIFLLKNENDHLFSFYDFMDFIISPDFSAGPQDIIDGYEENTIYNFNISDQIGDITFSDGAGKEFTISGISIIRDRGEINAMLIGGMRADLCEETKKLSKVKYDFSLMKEQQPDKQDLQQDSSLKGEAVPLMDDERFWLHIALIRIDLQSAKIDARYLLRDDGIKFTTLTDDPQAFLSGDDEFEDDEVKESYLRTAKKTSEHSAIFEMMNTLVLLPIYFKNFEDLITEERHPTKFGLNKEKTRWRSKVKYLSKEVKISFRRLISLIRENEPYPSNLKVTSSEMKIDRSGYWKSLKIGDVGLDKNGNKIHGRTWVEKTFSWFEDIKQPKEVFFERKSNISSGKNPGFIYVMRSAAHDKNIFKIGLTKRDSSIRATELTRETGSPDNFLVAQDWFVKDCILAEKLIHQELTEYRINPNREFFKADYKILFKTIHEIVEKINEE